MKKHGMVIVISLVLVSVLLGCNRTAYNKAMSLLNNGKYEAALSAFEQLGDYGDSAQMVKECKYQIALQKMESQNYEEALATLEQLGDYDNSMQMICESKYQIALQSMKSKDYQKAIKQFEEIIEFKDSSEEIQEAKYLYGKDLLSRKDYDMAHNVFAEIKDYKDSNSYLDDIVWNSLYDFIQLNATDIESDGTGTIKTIIGGVGGYHSDFIINMDSPNDLFFYFETTNPSLNNLVRRELVTVHRGNPIVTFTEYAQQSNYLSSLTEIGTVDMEATSFHKTMNVKLDRYYYSFQYGQYTNTSNNINDASLININNLGVLFATSLRSFKLFLEENGQKMTLSDLGFGNFED